MAWINAPMCEACWVDRHSVWEAVPEMSMRDIQATRLVSVEVPVRLREPELEVCHWCMRPTIFGVYVRTEVVRE